MAAEAERGQALGAGARGPVGRHIGVLVNVHVLGAERAQVRGHDLGDLELGLGRRHVVGGQGVGLRGDLAVADEAVEHVRHGWLQSTTRLSIYRSERDSPTKGSAMSDRFRTDEAPGGSQSVRNLSP